MRLRRIVTALAVVIFCASSSLSAQEPSSTPPLGDIARDAEAAKATAKKATKSYSNADLKADPKSESAPASPSTGLVSASIGREVSPEGLAAGSLQKVEQDEIASDSEENWRARAESIRKQLAPLQDRMAALAKPNPARDANPTARALSEQEAARVQQGLDAVKKQWDRLEQAARAAKVKSEWLDPRPRL